jgi:hypothetical protein
MQELPHNSLDISGAISLVTSLCDSKHDQAPQCWRTLSRKKKKAYYTELTTLVGQNKLICIPLLRGTQAGLCTHTHTHMQHPNHSRRYGSTVKVKSE